MKQKIACLLAVMSSVGLVTCMLFMIGCSTPWPAGGKTVAPDKSSVASVPPAQKGGAEVWAQNCAHCHNPADVAVHDLRWETPLAATNLCPDIVPGNPAGSRVYQLVSSRPGMPPIGTLAVDPIAVEDLGTWIAGMTSCP